MKIVIIGAGPVGLLQAIILKQLGFKNITILEKRKEYIRKQIVGVDPIFYYTLIPSKIRNKLDKKICYRRRIAADGLGICNTNKYYLFNDVFIEYLSPTMKIMDLEKELKNNIKSHIKYIKDLNIDINKKEANGIKYDVLIGADGAHSQVRKEVFKEKPIQLFKGYYTATFSFCCDIMNKKIDINNNLNNLRIFHSYQPRIRVFRSREGYYTIAIALQKEEYNNYKKGKLPYDYLKYLFKVFRFKGDPKKTMISHNVFPLDINEVKTVYKEINKGKYYLVGDASYSTHYFTGTGLNTGFESAFMIARDLYLKKNEYQRYFINNKGQRYNTIYYTLLPKKNKLMKNCNVQKNKFEFMENGILDFNDIETCYLKHYEQDLPKVDFEKDIVDYKHFQEYLIEVPYYYKEYEKMLMDLVKTQTKNFKKNGIPLKLKRFENFNIDFNKINKTMRKHIRISYNIFKNKKIDKYVLISVLDFGFYMRLINQYFKSK